MQSQYNTMTTDVKAETTMQVPEEVVAEVAEKVVEQVLCKKNEKIVEKSSSYREESNFLSDLKEHEKKALTELKTKLEEAILGNTLFKKEEKKECTKEEPIEVEKKEECKIKTEEKTNECEETVEIDRDVSIWGIPLLPSKANEATNVVLLKFLRARNFKVDDSMEMLKNTLLWRKEFKIDSISDEEFEANLVSTGYMSGIDRQGRPICYNILGVLDNEEVYEKTLATEEKREQFLRWRVQLMEKGVRELDFKPSGICSIVQINDLKNLSGSSKKEVRVVVNKAATLLEDNYPEFVVKNIFVNVPFWYFAYHSLLAPFLTQRSKSKLVFARPSKVTDALLKYIPIQEIPVKYGGMKRENDFEFSVTDSEATEVVIKAESTETIEIPTPEAGTTFIWDVIVLGWEVNYTEEFIPTDESSYTLIIQKGKKICSTEEPIRNTFKNNQPGKVVFTIQNCSGKKKKLFYRYKVKKACF